MQTEKDRQRIVEMGARPERTKVTGNIKFDQAFPSLTDAMKAQMAGSLGLLAMQGS